MAASRRRAPAKDTPTVDEGPATPAAAPGSAGDLHERIRQRAYDLWEAAGRPHGRDREHWEQAERELGAGGRGAAAPAEESPAPAPTPARGGRSRAAPAKPSAAAEGGEPAPAGRRRGAATGDA